MNDSERQQWRAELSARQRRIRDRLRRLVGPGAVAFFEDACQLVGDPSGLKATTHLVGHVAREIVSSLKDVLGPLVAAARPPPETQCSNSNDSARNNVELILDALGVPVGDEIREAWLSLETSGSPYALFRWTHRPSLEAPRPADETFQEFWRRTELVLDAVLDRMEVRFLELRSVIDGLPLESAPSKRDIQMLRKNVPNSPEILTHLFERLEHPGWLAPLRGGGFFSTPASAEITGATYKATRWPQGGFLRRMASQAAVRCWRSSWRSQGVTTPPFTTHWPNRSWRFPRGAHGRTVLRIGRQADRLP